MTKPKRYIKDQPPQKAELLTEYELLVEQSLERPVVVKENGAQKRISAEEAVLAKRMQTALSGNSHAQRQFLEDAERIAAKKQKLREEECERWARIKRLYQSQIALAAKEGRAPPVLYPHPDDIEIDRRDGVRIHGPMTRDEHLAAMRGRAGVEQLLLQLSLERKLKKTDWRSTQRPEPLYLFAVAFNETLPRRYRLASDAIITLLMQNASQTKRHLLRETYQGWRRLGVARPRGTYFLTDEAILALLNISRDFAIDVAETRSTEEHETAANRAALRLARAGICLVGEDT